MRIANPIHNLVFRRLMQDNEVAVLNPLHHPGRGDRDPAPAQEMAMLPENKRFLILVGAIGIVVIVLSMAARFLGSTLWNPEPFTDEAVLSLPNEPEFPPVAPSRAEQPTQPRPPPPIAATVEGRIPLEFRSLETRLTAMGQALSDHSEKKPALEKKMLAADALILQAEGIVGNPKIGLSAPSSAPVKSEDGNEAKDTDIQRLRERLGALKSRLEAK